ncbi:MAG TPA: hypothetical protein VH369_22225 [Bryobacteraceae bacterium]
MAACHIFKIFLRAFIVPLLLAGVAAIAASSQTTCAAQATQSTPPPGQTAQPPSPEQPGVPAPGKTEQGQDKRIMGVLPNYRTAEMSAIGHPLTPKEKMRIAVKDTFDYPLMILAAGYAGLYQLEDNHPEFGQGVSGYFKRLGTSYTDQVTGNMLTEGVLPVLFHQDPRYFRMASGTKKRRAMYALSRIFVTHMDSGRTTFNYAEVLGNGMSAAIGLSYYPDDRSAADYVQNWGIQMATDAGSQVLKEFWPDIKRWWQVRRQRTSQANH